MKEATSGLSAVLAHPAFIAMLSFALFALGALIATIINNTGDHGKFKQAVVDIKELLAVITKRQDSTDEKLNAVSSKLDNLNGQHEMMLKGRDILKKHG